MNLKNKRIIVTGAASGMGKKTAEILKEEGAYVIGVDRNVTSENVHEFYKADLSNKEAIDTLISQLPGNIDGLANIAGVPPTAHEDVVVKVNLVGLKYLTYGVIPKLNNNASIVNLASLASVGWPEATAEIKESFDLDFDDVAAFNSKHNIKCPRSYFFSKEALVVWTMLNRWTWLNRNITMNCVSPGPVDTPIFKDFIATLGDRVEEDRRIMDRDGVPGDVAPVVVFLLSEDAKWIRGANIPTDGGMFQHIQMDKHGYLK